MKYRVFPDYCSTGIWDIATGYSLDPAECGLTYVEGMALQYWNRYWEALPNGQEPEFTNDAGEFLQKKWDATNRRLHPFYMRWYHDGQALVTAINKRLGGDVVMYDVEAPVV